jgi:uncharacterized membrane protein YkoI
MSKNDINQNGIKNKVSRNILFGILAGIITAIGFTGISNVSAQEMAPTTTNDTSQMQEKVNFTGTIDVKSTIGEAFKSKVTVNIIDAINAAQTNVGANSTVKEAELTPAHGYLVYKIKVVGEDMKKYKVIVDPGNGQVLMKKEITWYDDKKEHEKIKYGEEKYDKYGHDEQYDKKKMMMMKDKKY